MSEIATAFLVPPRWHTPVLLCTAAPIVGAVIGAAANAIDDTICPDYFSIVMSWDGTHSIFQAIALGLLNGFALGLALGFFLTIAAAASTQMRCPSTLAMHMLARGIAILLICWALGGTIGLIGSRIAPEAWGFLFVGVPKRVSLPRFAWVGGSIWGAYGGVLIALLVCSIWLHRRWRRMNAPRSAFAVFMHPAHPRVQ